MGRGGMGDAGMRGWKNKLGEDRRTDGYREMEKGME